MIRSSRSGLSRTRSFDPVLLGHRECDAWAGYYQRRWLRVLAAAVAVVRAGFGMPWPRTLRGAYYVLRANQVWAPYPDNDPGAARALMRRFYALVAATHGGGYDPAEAARREVEWWRVHRERQRDGPGDDESPLVTALASLYCYLYDTGVDDVLAAARLRAAAMTTSDAWVAAGCDPSDPRLAEVRALLVRCYAALLAAVYRPPGGE